MEKRSPIIAVSGGKGGTGKSTVAVNLALALQKKGLRVLLIDADVDAPNVHVLFDTKRELVKTITAFYPIIDSEKCTKCGKCVEVCRYNALLQFGETVPQFFDDLCFHCGLCQMACDDEAILTGSKEMGWVFKGEYNGINLVMGELKLGESSGEIIVSDMLEEAKKLTKRDYDVIIIDSAPGAHCDVLRVLMAADYVLAVTEPTPLGFHDLKRILELGDVAKTPITIVLNKVGITKPTKAIAEITKEYQTRVIQELPFDPDAAKSYAHGKPIIKYSPETQVANGIMKLAEAIMEEIL